MGTKDGNIIATIITIHMPRNNAAAPAHVCPGIRIHAIDIVQPPGIGISPIADMDADQTIVPAALAAKSSAETPKKGLLESVVMVVPLPRAAMMVLCPSRREKRQPRYDNRDVAQPLPYSSWRRHQTPDSLRPWGARSSHWYMPQTPSTPRS